MQSAPRFVGMRKADDPAVFKKSHFFRSVGLELVTLLGFGRSSTEAPKPVLSTSLKIALSRASVHFLPSVTSIAIIAINLENIFIGRTFTGSILSNAINSALLQVASKIQELLIIASLTSIVVHTIRKELLGKDGVPLGALGGAFLFSSLSYFWSPELWGSFRAQASVRAKVRFYGLIVVSGLLAALAGPSTAVLIIPRDQSWTSGGAAMNFRGRHDDIWPQEIGNITADNEGICNLPNATNYAVCPSGGFQAMLNFAQTRFQIRDPGPIEMNISTSIQLGPQILVVPSDFQLAPSLSLKGNYRTFACESAVVGTHLAETMVMFQLQKDWYQEVMSIEYSPLTSTLSEYKYYEWLQIQTDSQIPAVRVGCSAAQNLSASDTQIRFPVLPEFACWNGLRTYNFAELNQSAAPDIRITWVKLPPSFGTVSAGLVLETPWDTTSDTRTVLGCSIDARWTNGTISSENSYEDINNYHYLGTTTQTTPWDASSGWSEFRPTSNSSWSPITFDQNWLNLLTPEIPDPADAAETTTTLNSILARSSILENLSSNPSITQTEAWNTASPTSLNRTVTVEWILANLFADGLSRTGSTRALATIGPPSNWTLLDYNKTPSFHAELLSSGTPLAPPPPTASAPYITERATIFIGGLSYRASQLTDYLAMCVLLTHVLLALGHTLLLAYTRESSSSWDSLPELIVLLHNSRPAPFALRNTSAGIRNLDTYAQVAVVRAVSGRESESEREVGGGGGGGGTGGSGATGAAAESPPRAEVIFREEERRGVELESLLKGSRARSDDAGSGDGGDGSGGGRVRLRTSLRSLSPSAAASQAGAPVSIEMVRPNRLYG